MSETRKVHLLDPACLTRDLDRVTQRIWSRCGRVKSWRSTGYVWPRGTSSEDQHRLVADGGVWARLPRQVQCDYCHGLVSWSASRDHILSASLFCGGLAGCLDPTLAALVTGDDAARAVALDLAEERMLDRPGMWSTVEREWLRVERHEHRWLPWEREHKSGRWMSPVWRRCPCGAYGFDAGDGSPIEEHRRPRAMPVDLPGFDETTIGDADLDDIARRVARDAAR